MTTAPLQRKMGGPNMSSTTSLDNVVYEKELWSTQQKDRCQM